MSCYGTTLEASYAELDDVLLLIISQSHISVLLGWRTFALSTWEQTTIGASSDHPDYASLTTIVVNASRTRGGGIRNYALHILNVD